ncbi:LacI family transcriptional regulator [Rhodopirellula rubra]|uniref:LacI family transcriptional regulator n=1 Tax=Aporhodopirellula rubra TaxID=980271 RepID=A0A7W5E4S1_9BACT|nr:DNA-binding transcriptional regulator [Aporhodopirellula rubra]MBB3209327.1 LacI family transcriptional regulator [Aporhodopirellula rubra]
MKNSKRVALVIETSKAFGRGLLQSISRYAHLHGRWALSFEERGLDDPLPDGLTSEQYDGIILRTRLQSQMRAVLQTSIPTVCVGEENPPGAFAVGCDETTCSELAAEHLVERNFRHFGFVGMAGYVWSDRRRDAFVRFVRDAGYDCSVIEPNGKDRRIKTWEPIRDQLEDWIVSLPKPIGVMCCYDVMARIVLEVCEGQSISVPEDVAVIGVDNDEVLCEVSQPPLSSVMHDTKQIGFEAAAMLDKLMRGETVSPSVIVAPTGVKTRRSTETLAIEDRDIAAAVAFIRRHACDGIEVNDVVDRVPLSRRTFERRFREQVGRSPLAEIRHVRMTRVKQFLIETDLKLDVVAAHSGFRNTPYMSAQFRKTFGVTPGQFRCQARD